MNRVGVTLLECMIYCAGISALLLMLMPWSLTLIDSAHRHVEHLALLNNFASACVVLERDVVQALPQRDHWITLASGVVMRGSEQDIGWSLEQTTLVRYTGSYSSAQARWITSRKALVCRQVSSFSVTPEYDGDRVKAVRLRVADTLKSIERHLLLGHRELL